MVARSPNAKPDRQKAAALAAAAALNPALLRETLKKVDRCMARLQELQYTVAGGAKVVSGVSLSPRSTRGYLRTSLRCKQETVRMRGGASAQKRSPSGKFGGGVGGEGAQWRRMSLPAMLLGETVLEIVQASQFARDIVTAAGATNREPPRTPKPAPRTRKPAAGEPTPLRARRAREKQSHRGGAATRGADAATPPSRSRVRSRIQFKPVSPVAVGRPSVSANRVSPKNRPWAKKAVMFPNPTFHASTSAATDPCATPSPSKKQKRLYKTRSPVAARQTPHKFLVKSPPSALGSKLRMHGKALPARPAAVSPPPPVKAQASPAKTRRCSFSPSRLATRLMSPIKARLSLGRSRDSGVGVGGGPMSGLKQRPGVSLTVRTVSSKISSR
ncbi:microtubule-binding protein TANGLED1 isoform 1 [Zea mays]|uniref:Microtubule-binding protein TANGLED1 n=1 Tax=Zea mays TaxID=4577 RepID=TAN1_MAIZE|nr:microtubule-binding protein TANGLED1 isoform 1 [Zea mays]Q9FUH9.1 RecName: Full=Microtubule-binding protein TANGLED1; AltName: Full=Protein PIGMY1 [Zea mays]AAG33234.1 microtubule-binding protein TANGLED1 [Zea mays]ACN36020.1 unknown [Zea mays]|eukprot:NP_001105636.1 microtubule-binding protein TANGLED1 isoform 1 [Zea mays]